MENFKHIELTPEQEKEIAQRAILKYKIDKDAEQTEREYWAKVNAPKVYKMFTADELYAYVIQKAVEISIKEEWATPFIVDEYNKEILFDLACYFTRDQRFEEKPKYMLKKGLLLFGNIGCGKTNLLRLFSDNQTASFMISSCIKVAASYEKKDQKGLANGHEGITRYFGEMRDTLTGKPYDHSDNLGICFDDLGTEDIKSSFGNKANVMAEIILARYDNRNLPYYKTHLTTNLATSELESTYGTRVTSRMREMFNVIKFDINAPDRRG